MKTFGLIGYPLGHSFSKRYFTDKFDSECANQCNYMNFQIENEQKLFEFTLTAYTLSGFNVTIPYKEKIISFLDFVDPVATKIGAVNCVKVEGSKLTGYNTDVYGFGNSLLELIGDQRPNALVLGTGGASKAVRYVLEELGIDYTMVSRTPSEGELSYAQVDSSVIEHNKLIVNTTPLGTFPNVDSAPMLTYDAIGSTHFLFDLVYNPPLTKFLELGSAHGAKTMNGYQMLVDQAEKSWEIWNDSKLTI